MKRILLISFYDQICLGARQIISVLKQKGFQAHLLVVKSERTAIIPSIDPNSKHYQIKVGPNLIGCGEDINPLTKNELSLFKDHITRIRPHAIGLSCRTVNVEIAKQISSAIRSVSINTHIIAGGIGPTIEPRKFLKFVDYVCIGEGESFFPTFFSNKATNVPGLFWKEIGVIKFTPPSKPSSLNELPPPDREPSFKHILEDDKIKPLSFVGEAYDIFCSRGCPSTCTYCYACQTNKIVNKYKANYPKWRNRSITSCIDELVWAKDNYNIRYVRFKDSIFTANKKWVISFLKEYDKHIQLPFHCFLDQRFVDEEIIKNLKSSGLEYTTVGIQSVNERIRNKVMGRNIKDSELVNYAQMLSKYKLQIKYDIISWNPFETKEHLLQGINFISQLPKGIIVTIYQLKIFPNSDIHNIIQTIKPSPLPDGEYMRFAILYQMILHSKKLEKKAFELLNEGKEIDVHKLNKIFLDEIEAFDDGYRLLSRRNINKGERLKVTDFKIVVSKDSGLQRKDIETFLHNPLCQSISRDTILERKHFYGSYESDNRNTCVVN
ncbi:MAG: cobalamin-dependent protein [Thermodesulfobacteriota bacterium]|nr:cobalamin-dependent protein [Thermodesulfobacteriota bacterium]